MGPRMKSQNPWKLRSEKQTNKQKTGRNVWKCWEITTKIEGKLGWCDIREVRRKKKIKIEGIVIILSNDLAHIRELFEYM